MSRLGRLTSSSVPSMHCKDAYQLGLVFRIKGALTMLELGVGRVTKLRRLREATKVKEVKEGAQRGR